MTTLNGEPPRTLRPEFTLPIPPRILGLPIDKRGYPVPWFVAWLANGEPEFRAMDVVKWARAVRERRCWICGESMGKFITFVVGPMCAISRTTAEPACHHECATWAARNCPFLARPHMVRREGDIDDRAFTREMAGIPILRNPGATCCWTAHAFKIFRSPIGGQGNQARLIEMGDPVKLEWWAEGRTATRREVEASIASGYPALDAVCDRDVDPAESRRMLAASRDALAPWLPA